MFCLSRSRSSVLFPRQSFAYFEHATVENPGSRLTRGLPQRDAYDVVLRDAMSADPLQPAGIYFGTRSGKLYASRNDGNSWQLIRDGLPPVVCVKAALVGDAPEAPILRKKNGLFTSGPEALGEVVSAAQREALMPVTVHLPGPLREYAAGAARVSLPGDLTTVREAISLLGERHPGVLHRILDEQGHVREHINIFVGDESIRVTGGLATPIQDGSEILIIPAVSGGIE